MTTELCNLAYKYGADKCPRIKHTYTPFYYELLKDKQKSIKKVLEMGVGCTGASLYMWRDFFTNAAIFGADIIPELMFEDDRITTFVCDQTNKDDLTKLVKNTGVDIDLFIDDGSHQWRDQIFTCKNLLPLLKKDVIYIIEDVRFPGSVERGLAEYDCLIPDLSKRYTDNNLVLVRNR